MSLSLLVLAICFVGESKADSSFAQRQIDQMLADRPEMQGKSPTPPLLSIGSNLDSREHLSNRGSIGTVRNLLPALVPSMLRGISTILLTSEYQQNTS
ncbi:MAG TPA: hypothetical protein DDW52_20745 [Planctomycetaceae bacterium]|nr:hypothetical protein [Planctomycetaceae bacterium]